MRFLGLLPEKNIHFLLESTINHESSRFQFDDKSADGLYEQQKQGFLFVRFIIF